LANVKFNDQNIVQEVKLGLEESAFIQEYTHEPYLFEDLTIITHSGSHQFGKKRIEVFRTKHTSFGVDGYTGEVLKYQNKPLNIEDEKYVKFKGSELIKVSDDRSAYYFDLNKNEAFQLAALANINLTQIDNKYIRDSQTKLFNVSSASDDFVIREEDGQIYYLDEGSIKPEKVFDGGNLDKYYGFALIDGQRKMFSKTHAKILKFGNDALEIAEIFYNANDKLVNALDTNGSALLLDIRFGFDKIQLAETENQKIVEKYGDKLGIGNKRLQHVYIETLGGKTRRVIDINKDKLDCFTLPTSLKQMNDQNISSVFAGNYICEIQLSNETRIDGKIFLEAEFETLTGKVNPVILEKETGKPIHLHGLGYRNELASSWISSTLKNRYYLGEHRMIGVKTLNENLKENQLLFSINELSSWLPFYNKYLPIFKKIIDVDDSLSDTWDYKLFELRESAKEKEYIAVEKKAPYRLLADKKSSEYHPRIVKSMVKSIDSPEKLTRLQRFFFADNGILVVHIPDIGYL